MTDHDNRDGRVIGDGNGWTRCRLGHRHWGRFGAAGLLITDGSRVVLQHRAGWTHEGGTWGIPGGARDSDETPTQAALREAVEETTLDPARVVTVGEYVDDHGGWSYTTVLATAPSDLTVAHRNEESTEVQWCPIGLVATRALHHGFAATWPSLEVRLRDITPPRHDG